jgi:hypothetical protein
MQIERLNKWHYEDVIDQLIQYGHASGLKEYVLNEYDRFYAKKILLHCQLSGINFVVLDADQTVKGMILSMRDRDLWMPHVVRLREVCWWVDPELRNTRAGAELFLSYKKQADHMLESGSIVSYSISLMDSSPSIDFARRGFKPLESTWIKGAV